MDKRFDFKTDFNFDYIEKDDDNEDCIEDLMLDLESRR